MKTAFSEFLTKINKNELKFINKKFESLFKTFSLFLIIDDYQNLPQNINKTYNQIKIIVVDYFIHSGEKFFIINFENKIIIIKQSKLYLLQTYFLNNLDSNFYFLNESKKIFDTINSFQYHELILNKDNLMDELKSFSQTIIIECTSESINDLWSLIKNSLFCFLIQKSYQKVNYNRITSYLQDKNIFACKKSFEQDDFFFLRHIDNGSSATVELIYHIESEMIFAKKTNYLNQDGFSKRDTYKREIQNYMELADYFPYFPYYITSIENKYEKTLIIEYIDGESLNFCIKKLKFNEKIKILFELMIAIQHLHNMHYVYRDLKPNNIIINHNKIAVLIDFDRMIKHDEDETDYSNVTNDFSSFFSAPELSEGRFSYKSDVYSIGMLISYMFKAEIKNSAKYDNLIKIYERCKLENPVKRPNLSELISFVYIQFFWPLQIRNIFEISKNENIEDLSEIKTIESTQNIFYSEKYCLYWIALTEYDNPISMLKFGYMYYIGSLVPFNYMKSFHYFYLSSKQNVHESQYNIGIMYYYGQYTQRDIAKSIEYFTKSSNQNYSLSQYNLYMIYLNDRSVQNVNKAIYYLQLSADNNYAVAQNLLGDYYRRGQYLAQNTNKAVEYYLKAADQDCVESLFSLGLMYIDGIYIERNVNKAIQFFSRASELNDVNSQMNLAYMFVNGKFVEKDIKKAIHYYALAADQNNENAQMILGEFYLKGNGVDIDVNKSIYYFSKAAKQNNVKAQINLGIIYLTGQYIKRDIDKSIQYFKQASNLNNSTAQLYLGEIYRNKKFGIQNIQNSIFYFKIAASSGDPMAHYIVGLIYKEYNDYKESFNHLNIASNYNIPEAQFELGNFYCEGKIVKKDINKALNYYKKAADRNLIVAQYKLATIYHYGFYIPRDIKKAIYYYKLASNAPEALFQLSNIYLKCVSIPCDIQEGFKCLIMAANQKYPPALFNLGSFYYYGDYGKRDINKALHYLHIAAEMNQPESMVLLSIIYKDGIDTEKNISKSLKYLTQASDLGYSIAQYHLGCLYLEGLLIEKNIRKAMNLLELSSKSGNDKASFTLGSVYHEGIEIEKDIKKATNYYIAASNMNNQFAKNNLGVIYKSNKIEYSIELFEESILKNKDKVAMLNLAKIYFYNKEISVGKYQNNWADLLIKSANQNYSESKVFLCVVLIQKIDFISKEKIELEIQKYDTNSLILAEELYEIIKSYQMENDENYSFYFEFYKNNDFRYFTENLVITGDFCQSSLAKTKTMNITKDFYDGFEFRE